MIVADVPPWMVRSLAIILGLLFGSFLNVVIFRVPKGESVVSPASHCGCGRPIHAYDNIPVLSWIFLRGRARCCGAKISFRYPMVEMIGGILLWALAEQLILRASPAERFAPLAALYLADAALVLTLVAAAFIDLDHMYLPPTMTIGGAVFALASNTLRRDLPLTEALIGSVIGYFIVWFPFIWLHKKLRGYPGMGLGDAKLLALIGAWFGWKGVLFALFAGSVQGTLAALVTFAVHKKIEDPESVVRDREAALAAGEELDPSEDLLASPPPEEGLKGARLAFGPFLILASLEYLIFGKYIVSTFIGWSYDS